MVLTAAAMTLYHFHVILAQSSMLTYNTVLHELRVRKQV